MLALAATPRFWIGEQGSALVLFSAASRPLRNDPRFLPLLEQWRLTKYWRDTATASDICADEPAPFCLALKEAEAKRATPAVSAAG